MFYCQVIKIGYDFEMFVCGSLIDIYVKNGNLQVVEVIFVEVIYFDLVCWNLMIGGYSYYGKVVEVIKLFDDIIFYYLELD